MNPARHHSLYIRTDLAVAKDAKNLGIGLGSNLHKTH
jgi:hypothetical protein